MSIETITTILYIWLPLSIIFPILAIWIMRRNLRLKNELVKQNYAVRHYEEMLYAARDGYLTYSLYKKKEYQYCSRRLATLLNLKKGIQSTVADVLSRFEQTEDLTESFNMLIKDGTSFETLAKTKSGRSFTITGTRISSSDEEINFSCLWFRDITKTTDYIDRVTEEAYHCRKKVEDFRILIDNLPCPVWLRNEDLNLTILNKQYLKLLGLKNFNELNDENSVLKDLGNTTNLLEMAKIARESNTPQKKQINILCDGDLKRYEITETPYYNSSLKTSHIIGSLVDITEFDEAKRNYRVHLDSHLEILSSLDTAFCIINNKHNFTFANVAFLNLWNLPENFLDNAPHYNAFLDKIREQKTLPEVSDFKAYKEEENKAFDALTEQREDLLYIPDGRTFRRLRAPHPDGTIIAYEDITDSLAAARKLGDLMDVQQGILNNLGDSVIILLPNLKLKYYNTAYLDLWKLKAPNMDNQPNLKEILDKQQERLPEFNDWNSFREDMQKHITSCSPFTLKLKNKQSVKVMPTMLADSTLMITYHKE